MSDDEERTRKGGEHTELNEMALGTMSATQQRRVLQLASTRHSMINEPSRPAKAENPPS
jgi:hypothetical protein